MKKNETTTEPAWWPDRQLRRHPISKVYVCGRQLQPPVYGHVVNFPRLEIPLSGCYQNEIEINGRSTIVRLRPGSALFAPANCWNLPSWNHRVSLMSLLFGRKQIGISIVSAGGSAGRPISAEKFSMSWPTGAVPRILEAMTELSAEGGSDSAMPELGRSLLICIRETLRRPVERTAGRGQSLLEDVCVYLQNNYQYDIGRDSVARQFGISPNHLSRLFHVQGHMTFSGYLTHVRIDRAKHLLTNYDLKLDDVSARCGFRDTPYFSRVFKRLAKLTPAAYRNQRKARYPAVRNGQALPT